MKSPPERFTRVLKDKPKGFHLVGLIGRRVAGQLMITFEWSDWRYEFLVDSKCICRAGVPREASIAHHIM